MINDEFYDHKAAVLMTQKTLQDNLAVYGFDTEGKQIHELVPMVAEIAEVTGSGIVYQPGEGITISGNKISVDFDVVAGKSEIQEQIKYTAGYGVRIKDNSISVITNMFALSSDVTYLQMTISKKADLDTNGKVPLAQLPDDLGGGGTTYTEGEGISISESNEISVDFVTVAKKTDIPEVNYPVTSVNGQAGDVVIDIPQPITYTAGTGIHISEENVISMVGGGGGSGIVYQQGEGIFISGETISVDFTAFAEVAKTGSYNDLSDKPTIPEVDYPVTSVNGQTGAVWLSIPPHITYTEGDGISIGGNRISVDSSYFASVATSGRYDDLKDKPTLNGVELRQGSTINIAIIASAGEGITFSKPLGAIAVDFNVVAEKDDIFTDDIIVGGEGNTNYHGTYTLQDKTATGYNRRWVNINNPTMPIRADADYSGSVPEGTWWIGELNPTYRGTTPSENPWDCEWSDGLIVKRASKYATKEYVDEAVADAGGGTGGTTYTEGEGISISESNEISVDFVTVARKSDIPTVDYPVTSVNGETGAVNIADILMPGTAIQINASGNQQVISLKFSDTTGIITGGLTGGMALDFNVVAKKTDIPTVDYPVTSVNGETGAVDMSNILMPGTAISIDKSGNQRVVSVKFQNQDGFMSTELTGGLALDFEVVAKKAYVDGLIGDINTILDEINGEEV